jgi:FkbM family methyltransferase
MSEIRLNKPEQAVKAILNGADLIVADVGAAFGLPWHLRVLERVATVLYFEPDRDAAEDIRRYARERSIPNTHVFQAALAATEGERTLYATNAPTGTSLLKPGSAFATEFGNPDYFYPMREISIRTRRMMDVLTEAGLSRVDTIKLDVQGAELEVLQGLGSWLNDETLAVEMEIGFPGAYLDQPGFGAVEKFMTAANFDLFDLRLASHHRHYKGDWGHYWRDVFRVPRDSTSLTKRITEADGIFFRKIGTLLARGDESSVRRQIVLYCTYGFFVEALNLVDRATDAGVLSDASAQSCHKNVMDWHSATRDIIGDSLLFERIIRFVRSASLRLQGRILGQRFYRWNN